MHLAEQSMKVRSFAFVLFLAASLTPFLSQINIPKLLWAFKYAQATDPTTGEKIRVSQDDFARAYLLSPPSLCSATDSFCVSYSAGHLTAPLPFECEIKVRSEQIKETIEREYEEVRPQLKQYEVSIAV
jgi:hypothetical protein